MESTIVLTGIFLSFPSFPICNGRIYPKELYENYYKEFFEELKYKKLMDARYNKIGKIKNRING